ncbi:DUF6542 domain-containing protein [Nocardioides caricicola]|uniref:DUF6542 domain-containing protein n=1 Tax=Nocardioides caricicola TaxID=634770 RepID=A0ABW0N575_9ACTN
MTQRRTLWEQGHESGRQVVALGLALALTAVVLDQAVTGSIGWFFDVSFVLICVGTALLVRPTDFFTVGVLPPLLMVAVFTLLGIARPEVIADRGDGVIQAVVSGLGHHAGALIVGYVLCLGILAVRQRVLGQQRQPSNRPGSPAPTRTTSG